MYIISQFAHVSLHLYYTSMHSETSYVSSKKKRTLGVKTGRDNQVMINICVKESDDEHTPSVPKYKSF